MSAPYPLFLKLEGRRVLVVGAGEIAARKIDALRAAGARVHVVATNSTESVRKLATDGAIEHEARAFAEGDVDDAWLVVAATDDALVQRRVADACEARRIFCLAVDDLANASAWSGAVIERAPFTIAISSAAEAPALTRLVREILEQTLPDAEWVEAAKALRARWKSEGTAMGSRFGELVRAFKERAG